MEVRDTRAAHCLGNSKLACSVAGRELIAELLREELLLFFVSGTNWVNTSPKSIAFEIINYLVSQNKAIIIKKLLIEARKHESLEFVIRELESLINEY